ncbi:MAG: 4-aminobutyrate--2-oxoglutarate transaminase [Clostridia bacterium]|nr:4-aminobutyrate--2-oxoglutarate transaminase [Clostridia bacterium]
MLTGEINLQTNIPGPKSQELIKLREQWVPRGPFNTTPVFAKRAKGALVEDVDGNVFIDFAGGIGIVNSGHCADEVVEAVGSQARDLIHSCFHVVMYEPYVRLAERLAGLTPGNFAKKTMLANSGAEAVENAIKIARAYTKKTGIIAFEGAFHGRTYMAMSITSKSKPYKFGFGPFPSDVHKLPYANCYRCYYGLEYPKCGVKCAESLERLLSFELPEENVAAVIAEPVQGEGGFIVPPVEFLPRVQEICRKHNILFIADEIQTGFGRTGKMLACEHLGLEPDLVTMSKSLGGGVPISAVTGRAEVMDAPGAGQIGGTFGGSPLGCAASLKVIELMQGDDLPGRAAHMGEIIMGRFRAMQERYDIIGDVRGLGAMCALEFVKDRNTREPYKEAVGEIVRYCFEHGLIVLSAGSYSNVIRTLPPLVMTDSQLAEALDVIEQAVAQVAEDC